MTYKIFLDFLRYNCYYIYAKEAWFNNNFLNPNKVNNNVIFKKWWRRRESNPYLLCDKQALSHFATPPPIKKRQGGLDSNQHHAERKSGILPLNYLPAIYFYNSLSTKNGDNSYPLKSPHSNLNNITKYSISQMHFGHILYLVGDYYEEKKS